MIKYVIGLAFALGATFSAVSAVRAANVQYVKSSCSQTWGRYAWMCCTTYTTNAECTTASGKACTAIDVDAQKKSCEKDKAAPAC